MGYEPIEHPKATAVIPVYNEEACLEACLRSLAEQDFGRLEILVVDDGSTDASTEICRRAGVRVLSQRHRGPGAARNLGARQAAGNIVLFVDADMTFDRGYVSALTAPVISGAAAGTSHAEEYVSNWENPWARLQTWFLGCPDKCRSAEGCSSQTTVYRAVRRDFFLEAGGFTEDAGRADDSSLADRTGVLPKMVSGAVCYHSNIDGPRDAFFEARWRGRDMGSRLKSFAEFLLAALIHRNPLRDLAAGLRLMVAKREPRAPLYAAVFSLGFQYGLFSAFFFRRYAK